METTTGKDEINQKLKTLILPNVKFEDVLLEDAVALLEKESKRVDPEGKGVKIAIRLPNVSGGADLGFGDLSDVEPDPIRVTLRLSNVLLVEAIRYTAELARLRFQVEDDAIVICPGVELVEELFTKVFQVPHGFLAGPGGVSDDPFANLANDPGGGTILGPRPTARSVLEEAGIPLLPGSSAIYNPAKSKLIVRSTQANLDLVEAFVKRRCEETSR